MSSGPDLFHIAASLQVESLSAATRALVDAARSAPDAPQLIDWRGDDGAAHLTERGMPPDDVRSVGLAFAGETAFGVLEHKDDGTFGLGVQQVVAGLGENGQRTLLEGWAEVCRALLRQGVMLRARVNRQVGGHCVPYLPLAEDATHLVVRSAQEIAQAFVDPDAFIRAWDAVEAHAEMRLCLRGLNATGNPAFLAHILPGQMAMARAARPGLTRIYRPQFEPGELEILEAGEPTLTGVGYHAREQVYEFAGHTPAGIELRCVDLLTVWRAVSAGEVEGGGRVREVRVVFMDTEQAGRSAELLQMAGAVVYWEDSQGRLQRVP